MQVYNQPSFGQGYPSYNQYSYSNLPPVSYQGGNSYFQTPNSYNQAYSYPYNYYYGGYGNCNTYPYYYGYGGYPCQGYQGYGYQKKDCGCGCGGHGNCGQYGISFDRITPQYPRKLGHSFVTSGSNQYQKKGVTYDYVSETAPYQSQRRVTYQPYTRKYFDYQQYIQYVPVQKSYWDYQKVTKQTDFIPKEYYQSKIQYVPQQKISQKVRYIPIEQQIVHVPQQSLIPKSNVRLSQHIDANNRAQQIATINYKTVPKEQVVITKPSQYRETLMTNNTINSSIKPAVSTVQMVPISQTFARPFQIQSNIRPVIGAHLVKNLNNQTRQQQNSVVVNQRINANNRIQSSFGVQLNQQSQVKQQQRNLIDYNNMSQSGVRVVQSKFTEQKFPQIRHQNRFQRQYRQKQQEQYSPNINKRESQASLVNQISKQQNFR